MMTEDESEPTTPPKPRRAWLSASELRRIAEGNDRNDGYVADGEGSAGDTSPP